MNAGVAKTVITPPVGIELTGYAGRPGPSEGVHDDLYARAVALEEDGCWAAILTLDLLGLTADQVAKIRNLAAGICAVPAGNIMVSCSHTHAGPATQLLRRCGTIDWDYVEQLYKLAAETVAQAASEMSPVAAAEFGRSKCKLGINRRLVSESGEMLLDANPDGIADQQLSMLALKNSVGWPIVTFFNYACHGVVLGRDNQQISADWIWPAIEDAEAFTGAPAVFLQGCCGDINPRFRGSFGESYDSGEIVGHAVIDAIAQAHILKNTRIRTAGRWITLPLQPLPPKGELRAMEAELTQQIKRSRAKGESERSLDVQFALLNWCQEALSAPTQAPEGLKIEIQAIGIGPVKIVAIPGEAFTELGLKIKKLGQKVIVSAYTNGNIGYIPTATAFAEGGYEVDMAYKLYGLYMIGQESEELIIEAAKDVLKKIG